MVVSVLARVLREFESRGSTVSESIRLLVLVVLERLANTADAIWIASSFFRWLRDRSG